MTKLTEEMYQIFDQPNFSFKKIKEEKTPQEVDELKQQFKQVWQVWKEVNQNVATQLPEGLFDKVHVESWTNGWNLRNHYWASYRLKKWANYNPCISVMFDKDQLLVYLMFQHYQSAKRSGDVADYNQLLAEIPAWSKDIDLTNWYVWDKDDMDLNSRVSLADYLNNTNLQNSFNQRASETSFLVGKFAFRHKVKVDNMEEYILSGIQALLPLYQKCKF
ncbi:hypothetical protein J2Z60_000461 [Lactobacillus colini]|uniref:Glucose-6-phosphate 1-dehydrogenase n=1 Tax=Lactobacillus colini TaxID=1819254 RepID=A0ABS4MC89_9LACO|nr:HI_0552 family protein [Lactobacillus colini]MBP2057297.1 hypothetical protein [Lactobacillus colini]